MKDVLDLTALSLVILTTACDSQVPWGCTPTSAQSLGAIWHERPDLIPPDSIACSGDGRHASFWLKNFDSVAAAREPILAWLKANPKLANVEARQINADVDLRASPAGKEAIATHMILGTVYPSGAIGKILGKPFVVAQLNVSSPGCQLTAQDGTGCDGETIVLCDGNGFQTKRVRECPSATRCDIVPGPSAQCR